MLIDIFSSFDPALYSANSYINSVIFWISSIFAITLTSLSFWISPSRLTTLTHYPLRFIHRQIIRTTGKHIKGFPSILSSLFLIIIILNISGLAPYIFRLTRHLIFTLTFALPIWTALIVSSIINAPSRFIAALLPSGAPDWLNPFLVLIETIRTIVRPITLSFRLAANISAGHIVLTLIGVYTRSAAFYSLNLFILLIITQIGYILFEVAICLIQAYIFTLLLSLYREDHT